MSTDRIKLTQRQRVMLGLLRSGHWSYRRLTNGSEAGENAVYDLWRHGLVELFDNDGKGSVELSSEGRAFLDNHPSITQKPTGIKTRRLFVTRLDYNLLLTLYNSKGDEHPILVNRDKMLFMRVRRLIDHGFLRRDADKVRVTPLGIQFIYYTDKHWVALVVKSGTYHNTTVITDGFRVWNNRPKKR